MTREASPAPRRSTPSSVARPLTIAILLLLVAVNVGVASRAEAAASLCSDVVVVAARGSGEDSRATNPDYSGADQGVGPELWGLFSQLRTLAAKSGKTVALQAAHYPAVGIGPTTGDSAVVDVAQGANSLAPLLSVPGIYTASVALGGVDIARRINGIVSTCPSSKIVLIGYSQGVHAMGEGLALLPAGPRARIAAAAFFGDPKFDPNDTKATLLGGFLPDHSGLLGTRIPWSEAMSGPVFSYCHAWDPICNGNSWVGPIHFHDLLGLWAHDKYSRDDQKFSLDDLWAPHEDYGKEAVPDAVTRLATVLGLDLPPAPRPPTDTAFVIDSTGSMQGEIDDVKNNVEALANAVASTSASFRFALVDFKDITSEDSAYIARVDTPFTSDIAAFHTAVGGITAQGGGDTPEMQYSGVMAAIHLQWRKGVRKSIVVVTDAPAKDPEPESGLTLDDVTKAALALDPAQVYGVAVNGAGSDTTADLERIADANGGSLTVSEQRDSFVSDLTSVLERAGTAPTAQLSGGTSAVAGKAVPFSAAGTTGDVRDPIVSYDWNWGDTTSLGLYDETTGGSRDQHTYAAPGDYTASVRVRTRSGLSGLATTTVHVVAVPSSTPPAPRGLTARSDDGLVELAWRPVTGATAYAVLDGRGRVVSGLSDDGSSGVVRLPITGLRNDAPVRYRVEALNAVGPGAPSAEIMATPRKAPTLAAAPSVAAGELVRVRGTHFPPGSRVELVLTGAAFRFALPSVRPDAAGRLDTAVAVPLNATPGRARLTATTADPRPLDRSGTAALTIRPAAPLLVRYWWVAALAVLVVALALSGILLTAIRRLRRRAHASTSAGPTPPAGTTGAV